MIQSLLGNMLREQRERFNISQEDLCGDACAVSTLSRLENGRHMPSRKTIEYFFSKLGMRAPLNMIPLSDEDYIRCNIESEIMNRTAGGNYEIMELLERYKAADPKMDSFEHQFYETYFALYNRHHDFPLEQCQKQFADALRLTIKDFELGKNINANFLSSNEIELLNEIALTEYDMNHVESAIWYFEYIIDYCNKEYLTERERGRYLPPYLFNLSNYYGKLEKYEKALELTDKGIAACVKYGDLVNFPYFIFNKGYGQACLGNLEEGKNNIALAFGIFKQMGKNAEVSFGSKEVNKKFGFDFPEE